MDTIDRILDQDGLVLLREHPELGSGLYRRWHEGRLTRLHPGVFAASGPVPEPLRLVALCRWSRRGVIHAQSAASLWLDGSVGSGTVHLANPVRLVTPPGVVLTLRQVPGEHVRRLRGLSIAGPAYCAAEVAATDEGRAAMRMFIEGLTDVDELAGASATLAGTLGNATRGLVVRSLAENPWSPAERRLHDLLRSAGITDWVANTALVIDGRRLLPDVLFRRARLAVEVDGYAFHGGRAAFQNDRERLNLLAQVGLTVLRFTWEDLTARPELVIRQIKRTVEKNLQVEPLWGG